MAEHLDVAGYVLGTLTPSEADAFEAHLAECADCRVEVAELGSLPAMLASAEVAPPAQLRQRTFDAVAAAREGGAVVTPLWPRPQGPRPQGQRAPQPRRNAARWIAATAAALLVVAAVGGGAVLLGRDSGSTTVALVAADVGAGRGEAVVRPSREGREVRLQVSGLPANPPGTYYECWFVGPGDTEQRPNRVSAGTFTVGSDGTATVMMYSAADPARYPRMGVTLEPDDGNPARTGPKYLVSR